MISEIGIITLSTLVSSLLIIILRMLMKSKCSQFSLCWGCLEIDRDIEAEVDIENNKIEHNIKSNDDINNINNILSNVKNNNNVNK